MSTSFISFYAIIPEIFVNFATAMKRKLKYIFLWLRRQSNVPLFILAGVVIMILFFNDDTSFERNKEYDRRISALEAEIKLNKDSARYYEDKYNALLTEREDMERVAREQYGMQRSIEDVYIVEE